MSTLSGEIMGFFDYVQSFFNQKGLEHGVSAFKDGQPQYPTDNFVDNALGGYGKNEVVYAGIQEITSSLAEAPLQALDSDNVPVDSDPTIELLKRPNPFMSGYEFWELTVNHLYLSGNAYWFKMRTGRNKIKEIWPLRPDRLRVVPDAENFIKGYIYNLDGQNHFIKKEDILHFKLCNPTNEFVGMSPLRPAVRQIATDNDATDFSKVMLQNGGVPSGILRIPEPLSREARDRIKSQWKQAYGGSGRGEIAVLEGDTSFEQISLDMQSLAFADLRNISESRILMCLGVPPILIGAKVGLDRATYANYKEARASFWEETISALQRRLTAKLETDKDLNPRGRRFHFDISKVPAMSEQRQQKFTNAITGLQNGLLTQDEARAEIGLEPAQSPIEIPAMSEEGKEEIGQEKGLEAELETKQAELDLLRDSLGTLSAADKFFDRFEHWAKKEFKKQGRQFASLMDEVLSTSKALEDDLNVADLNMDKLLGKAADLELTWAKDVQDSVSPIMRGLMKEAGEDASAKLDIAFDISNAETLNFVREQEYRFANSVGKHSGQQIQTAIKNAIESGSTLGELKSDLKNRFAGKMADNRAAMIARTETIRAANEGSRAAYKSAGVVKMRWLASSDPCPYCSGLNGKVVSVEDNFLSQGDEFQPKGATRPLNMDYGDIPSPPCHPGCRCTIVPETE
jgi:HK97 family phage portal protein